MSFRRKQRGRAGAGGLSGLAFRPAETSARLLAWGMRVALTLAVVAAAAGLALTLRLAQGPLDLPWLAQAMADEFNGGGRGLQVEVEGVSLAAGDDGGPGGLELSGVTLANDAGVPLLSVPRLSARIDLLDLVAGQFEPSEITITGAAARLVRTESGQFRFALRDGGSGNPPASGDRIDLGQRIMEAFVGGGDVLPQLQGLRRITIAGADLEYVNAALGRSWRSERADLTLRRTEEGAALDLDLALTGEQGGAEMAGGAIEVTAERRRGTEEADVTLAFLDVRPEHLAGEVPALDWLAVVDAPVSGRLTAVLSPEGALGDLSGGLRAENGRVLALEEDGVPFERFALDFAYAADERRMRVERLEIAAPAADLALAGFADLEADAEGRTRGLAAQLDIADLRLYLPEVFAGEHRFDGGQIVARVDLATRAVEIAEARLAQGPLTLAVEGRVAPDEDGWATDLRVTGRDVAVDRLVALWPLPAADGARSWLAEHLRTGTIDELLAQMRLGRGEPEINLDFRYSGLAMSYLDGMSVVRQAEGQGHLTWDSFDLVVESARVEPVEGQPVHLDGTTVRLPDLWARPALAEIAIRGHGRTSAVLALIDQQPLGFPSKLGLEPAGIDGTAKVEAVLNLPLVDGLKVEEVQVEAAAQLSDLAMPFASGLTGPMRITAPRVALTADNRGMTVDGKITANGTPVRLDWEERYSGANKGRDISLSGRVTPADLAELDMGIPGFDGGSAAVDLEIAQARGRPTRVEMAADLGEAAVTVEPVFWSKPPGAPGSFTAAGTHDGRLNLDRFRFEGPGLEAAGTVRLMPAGGVESAHIEHLVLDDALDLTVDVAARDGGFALDIGGRWFDLAFLERSKGESPPPVTPVSARYSVDQVKLSEAITLGLVEGDFVRQATGRLEAVLEGRVDGVAPVSISYARPPGGPGRAQVTGEDAGRVLDAAGLFSGAHGGRLTLETTIAPDPATSFEGTARIRDVVVRQEAQTFRRVLEKGELDEAAEEAQTGGIPFDSVTVPFAIRGDRIQFGTALAVSPTLAIKATGAVNQATEGVNLRGVISPAYALTGALNNIPLIGTLLGGEGEGLLAMTFTVSGSVDDPAIAVNPLSLLAPGFLRNLFEGGAFGRVGPPPPAEVSTPPSRASSPVTAALEEAPVPPPRTPAEEAAADARQAARLRQLLGENTAPLPPGRPENARQTTAHEDQAGQAARLRDFLGTDF